jgi:hypothetical protein
MECNHCQLEVEADASFCKHCGVKLAGPADVPAPPPANPVDAPPVISSATELVAVAPANPAPPPAAAPIAIPPPVYPVYPGTVNIHYPSRLEVGAPVPDTEQILWEGRQCFWAYVPGIVRAACWCCFWLYLGSAMDTLIGRLKDISGAEWQEAARFLTQHAARFSWVAYGLSLLAFWGIIRRILQYLNAYYHLTTQRIKIRTGIFSQTINQIELFRLKDAELERPFLGRIFKYANIRLISSDRIAGHTLLAAMPDGEQQLEMIRIAAQHARAQSGTVNITE